MVQEDYHSQNPYHNAVHAADVTQAMHCYLREPKVMTTFHTDVAFRSFSDFFFPRIEIKPLSISRQQKVIACWKVSSKSGAASATGYRCFSQATSVTSHHAGTVSKCCHELQPSQWCDPATHWHLQFFSHQTQQEAMHVYLSHLRS